MRRGHLLSLKHAYLLDWFASMSQGFFHLCFHSDGLQAHSVTPNTWVLRLIWSFMLALSSLSHSLYFCNLALYIKLLLGFALSSLPMHLCLWFLGGLCVLVVWRIMEEESRLSLFMLICMWRSYSILSPNFKVNNTFALSKMRGTYYMC